MNKQPSTLTLELRCEIKDLATIARFLMGQGVILASRGGLAREAIHLLSNILVAQSKVPPVENTVEAIEILNNLNIGVLNRAGRMSASLLNAVLLDNNEHDPSQPITADDVIREMASLSSHGANHS